MPLRDVLAMQCEATNTNGDIQYVHTIMRMLLHSLDNAYGAPHALYVSAQQTAHNRHAEIARETLRGRTLGKTN